MAGAIADQAATDLSCLRRVDSAAVLVLRAEAASGLVDGG